MSARTAIRLAMTILVMTVAGVAQAQDKIQDHFNNVANKVKATPDPAQKRDILNKSFDDMIQAMNTVEGYPLTSKEDKAGIEELKANLKDKQDELAGHNGYAMVPDAQLNEFAEYTLQDLEQADQYVTISLVSLLLIIIIIILLA